MHLTKQCILVVLAAFFSSCSRQTLTVFTDYLSHENLASYYIRTPDPCLNQPTIGQRLLVFWQLPSCLMSDPNVFLSVKIRMRNREQIEEKVCIAGRRSGHLIYPVLNQDFKKTGGILTYKVDLIVDGCLFEEWKHQLWAELIQFTKEPLKKPNLDEFDLPPAEDVGTDFDLEEV